MQTDGSFPTDVYAMEPDGSDVVQLTDHPANDDFPVRSPDGTKIAFARWFSSLGAPNGIYVMDADGGDAQLHVLSGDQPDRQARPNRAPDCSAATPSRPELSPATHKFVPVAVEGVSDPDGDAVTVSIEGVTQDERVTGPGDPTAPDATAGSTPGGILLRAERSPQGDGRVYQIAFTASDGTASCSGTAAVAVRRHKKRPTVDSAPPSYDSFTE